MAFDAKTDWQTGDEYTAAALNRVEKGVADAHDAADAAQRTADGKADPADIPDISGKADRSEIPDVSGLATQADLDAALSRIDALEAAVGGA